MTSKFDKAHWLALLLPAALLAGAYGSQYIGGLFPCEMCWWQRYPHFAAVAIAAIAFGVGNLAFRKTLVALDQRRHRGLSCWRRIWLVGRVDRLHRDDFGQRG